MNEADLICNEQLLIAMLNDEVSDDKANEILRHVEHCALCQNRLNELAASDKDWSMAVNVNRNPGGNSFDFPTIDLPMPFGQPMTWNDSMAKKLLAPPSHPEMLGRIGRYEVERLIGSGGMGVVFKAFDSELNRPVAIKLLAPHLVGSAPSRKRFAREARAAAAVAHPHVVPIHAVETNRETPFMVMKFVAGESLHQRIERRGALEIRETCRIGMQVADGLAAAHKLGLVHRDIKPANILVEEGVDRCLITDFGLARAADDASLTRTGVHTGTPQYMSPEQAAGISVDERSDLFSLGSMIYTMCTGQAPFRAETSIAVLRRISDSEPKPIREINPDIPEWLELLTQKLMAKSPENRINSAKEVKRLLERCLQHLEHPSTVELPKSLRNKRLLSKPVLHVIAVSLLAILTAAAILFLPQFMQRDKQMAQTANSGVPVNSSGLAPGNANGLSNGIPPELFSRLSDGLSNNQPQLPAIEGQRYDLSFVPDSAKELFGCQPKRIFQIPRLEEIHKIFEENLFGEYFDPTFEQAILVTLKDLPDSKIILLKLADSSTKNYIEKHSAFTKSPATNGDSGETDDLYETGKAGEYLRVLDNQTMAIGTSKALDAYKKSLKVYDSAFDSVRELLQLQTAAMFAIAPTNIESQTRPKKLGKQETRSLGNEADFKDILGDSAYILASISVDEFRSQAAFTALCVTPEKKQIVHKTVAMLPTMFMVLSRAKLEKQNRYLDAELIKAIGKAVVSEPTKYSSRLTFPLEDKGYGSLSRLISSYLKESSPRLP